MRSSVDFKSSTGLLKHPHDETPSRTSAYPEMAFMAPNSRLWKDFYISEVIWRSYFDRQFSRISTISKRWSLFLALFKLRTSEGPFCLKTFKRSSVDWTSTGLFSRWKPIKNTNVARNTLHGAQQLKYEIFMQPFKYAYKVTLGPLGPHALPPWVPQCSKHA